MKPIRDAATVIIGRQLDAGEFEIFMLRRHHGHEFMANMWVFPGGRIDERDMTAEVFAVVEGLDEGEAARRMGGAVEARLALGLYVAAVRETFEEAGLLLARRPGEKGLLAVDEPLIRAQVEELRARVDSGEMGMAEVCGELGVVLCGEEFGFFAHWVTPEFESRRYDTRFFVTRAPKNQAASHDNHETTRGVWITPAEALRRYEQGGLNLAPPTLESLSELAGYESIDAVIAATKERVPPRILPRVVEGEEIVLEVLSASGEAVQMALREGKWVRL